jgi:hypothetical protein
MDRFKMRILNTDILYETNDDDLLRDVDIDGCRLRMWDTNTTNEGRSTLAYVFQDRDGKVLFGGADYGCAPGDAIDSDGAVRNLIGFLTCKPGDTDDEYFEHYTERQMEFAETDAEELSLWAMEPDDSDSYVFRLPRWTGSKFEKEVREAMYSEIWLVFNGMGEICREFGDDSVFTDQEAAEAFVKKQQEGLEEEEEIAEDGYTAVRYIRSDDEGQR